MRDVRKVKNRLELRLDSTQVFFLFAGLVTFTAFVFILGVVVGRAQRPDPSLQADNSVTLPTATPRVASLRDSLPERDTSSDTSSSVETIYDLGNPGNDNSITAAIPSATATTTAAATSTPTASVKSRYTVQVAAYTEADAAFEFVEKLRELGIEAYSVTYAKPQGPTYHRVRVGRFVSKAEADKMALTLGTRVGGVQPAVMLID